MTEYIKYPRTFHLPWSEGVTNDDVKLCTIESFEGREIVVSEKCDGECTTMYSDHIHARSLSSSHHPSRSWVKQLHSTICRDIPDNWRIVGENMFAYHSILYLDLPSYFLCYGIYDENNFCISWDETVEICAMLNLHTVPIIYRGVWDEQKIRSLWTGKGAFPTFTTKEEHPKSLEDFEPTTAEGYVVRVADRFHYDHFGFSVAKMVRKDHVQCTGNWMQKPIFPNLLKK